MIRIICRANDVTLQRYGVNECPQVTHKTFDVELPEVEQWLNAGLQDIQRDFVGIEIVPNRIKEQQNYIRELEDKLAAACANQTK